MEGKIQISRVSSERKNGGNSTRIFTGVVTDLPVRPFSHTINNVNDTETNFSVGALCYI